MNKEVIFDRESYKLFKDAHESALQQKVEVFTFDGNEYVVGYAGYLLEHLSHKLGIGEQNETS